MNFTDINPLEPLLWVNKVPLYTLAYLLQLDEDVNDMNEKSSVLWSLTRQLLISEDQKQKGIIVDPKIIERKLVLILENEVIQELLKSNVIHKEILSSILEAEELEKMWCDDCHKKLENDFFMNEKEVLHLFDNETMFTQQNVYEVYTCQFNETPYYFTPSSILELEQMGLYTMKFIGGLTLEQIQKEISFDSLITGEINPNMHGFLAPLKVNPDTYYFISGFFEEYKAPFEMIKNDLIEFLVEENIESEWEDHAQELLESSKIEYNEPMINAIFTIKI